MIFATDTADVKEAGTKRVLGEQIRGRLVRHR